MSLGLTIVELFGPEMPTCAALLGKELGATELGEGNPRGAELIGGLFIGALVIGGLFIGALLAGGIGNSAGRPNPPASGMVFCIHTVRRIVGASPEVLAVRMIPDAASGDVLCADDVRY
ncbi:hypothetical protein [Stieleria varia]|uniref:hypothetical protein n=1 Tax=Stieleria varia TaxID=2528005 RepID=UPI0018D21DA8|nr:hypothetical protein [Stieleria varia]